MKRCSLALIVKSIKIENCTEIALFICQIAKFQKFDKIHYCRDCKDTDILIDYQWKCKIAQQI